MHRFSVAVPASLVSDVPHLREKTAKLGLIARACSIFGVNEIILYRDNPQRNQRDELDFCRQILEFIETPQYLRKRMFRLNPYLRFTGILPPLQTPPHNVPQKLRESKIGDIRDGVVAGSRDDVSLVDVGLERVLECERRLPIGQRVTVRIIGYDKELVGEFVSEADLPREQSSGHLTYWGYKVRVAQAKLGQLARSGEFELTVGTSRFGSPIGDVWDHLTRSLQGVGSVLVAFGSPKMGLGEILRLEGRKPEEAFDYYVNTVPHQNVATVRTEEALLISLGLLNLSRTWLSSSPPSEESDSKAVSNQTQ